MKAKNILYSNTVLIFLLLASCGSKVENNSKDSNFSSETTIQVIQFHSEHRCMTCNKIETLTKETLKDFPNISFSLVNVDDKKNEKKSEQFEATGTALFLYNSETGKKKDLTDFAFMNAGNKEKFTNGLKKEISYFRKS